MVVLRTSNFQEQLTQLLDQQFQDINTLLSLLFTTKSSSACQFKYHFEFFQLFKIKVVIAKCKKKTAKNPLNTISVVYSSLQAQFFTEHFYRQVLSILVFLVEGHFLNIRVFLLRNYQLKVALQKLNVLKTNICPRSKASKANMLAIRTDSSKT